MFSTSSFAAQRAATAALQTAIAAARPGLQRCAVAELLATRHVHPVVAREPIVAVGLALEETRPKEPDDEVLEAGSVHSLRVGIRDKREAAIVSAMVAITTDGAETLWVRT
jgi:hypothetical protein